MNSKLRNSKFEFEHAVEELASWADCLLILRKGRLLVEKLNWADKDMYKINSLCGPSPRDIGWTVSDLPFDLKGDCST